MNTHSASDRNRILVILMVLGLSIGFILTAFTGTSKQVTSTRAFINNQDQMIVVIPDTQYESVAVQEQIVDWIVRNKTARNIILVLHTGDITDRNTETEWQHATSTYARLDGVVANLLALGNHDMTTTDRNTDKYNAALRTIVRSPGNGGVFEEGKYENRYLLVDTVTQRYVAIALEFGPRDEVLAWANSILSQHRDRMGILLTHAYMNFDDTRIGLDDAYNPHHYISRDTNDGEEMWTKLVSKNASMGYVFSGHILGDGIGFRTDSGVYGNAIHQMLSNYQVRTDGGGGYIRLITISPSAQTVTVQTYSPFLKNYLLDAQNNFVLTGTGMLPLITPSPTPVHKLKRKALRKLLDKLGRHIYEYQGFQRTIHSLPFTE